LFLFLFLLLLFIYLFFAHEEVTWCATAFSVTLFPLQAVNQSSCGDKSFQQWERTVHYVTWQMLQTMKTTTTTRHCCNPFSSFAQCLF